MSEMSAATDLHAFAVTLVPGTNNLKAHGPGTVRVTPVSVVLEYHVFRLFGISLGERGREFAFVDIVDVEQRGPIVVLRTRDGASWIDLKLRTSEEAAALRALLPAETTPEFRQRFEKEQQFHEHLAKVGAWTPVTLAIIALNVAVFLVMLLAGAGLVQTEPAVHIRFGSNYGPLTWTGEPWRLITSAFIHFGIIHLAFNMYALYSGRLTERLLGSTRFALVYLLSALSGSVVSGWWEPLRNSAGASGAIFGVYGALLVFFALRRADIPRDMLRSSGRGALTLCVYSLVLGATNPMVDNACHIGGLLGGALAAFFLVRPVDPAARAVPQPLRLAGVAIGICAALCLLAAPLALPGGPRGGALRVQVALDRFAPDESKLVDLFQEIAGAYDAKQLSADKAAERIEIEVLGPWENAMQPVLDIPPITPVSSRGARQRELLRTYVVERKSAFELTIQTLRHPGSDADEKRAAAWKRVNDLIHQLEALPGSS
jgi:rhomboid protease GluP